MATEIFLAYCLATAILILIPGPIVTLVVAQSLKHGTRTGLATVAGTSCGTMILVSAGAFGLSTVLGLMADVFDVVRWLGAGYLIYLGIREWRSRAVTLEEADAGKARPARVFFGQGFLVAITNPKTILFFAAFFPQFIDPLRPLAMQLVIMSASFVVIAATLDGAYALLAGRLRNVFRSERAARLRGRITGTLLIVTGIGLALTRRA